MNKSVQYGNVELFIKHFVCVCDGTQQTECRIRSVTVWGDESAPLGLSEIRSERRQAGGRARPYSEMIIEVRSRIHQCCW